MPEIDVQWYQILKYKKDKYVIYGFGQPSIHIMDWNGCNFHHGRLRGFAFLRNPILKQEPILEQKESIINKFDSPIFNSIESALDWLTDFNKKYNLPEINGHFNGDEKCQQCKDRYIEERFFYKGRNIPLDCIQAFLLDEF